MKFFYCIFALFLTVASINADVYKDCGSQLATIHSVTVSDCDGSAAECILKRNTNVTITVDLTPNVELSEINTLVHGVMMGMPVPFPLANPNACQGAGLSCPLTPATRYTYSASLPVLKTYPKVKVDVKWELQDPTKKDVICLMIPAKIQ